MVSEGVKSYTTNNLNQYTQVTNSGATNSNYTYDENGNLINDGDKMYAYDYKNRLVQVTPALGTGTIVEFKYDVLGRRYEKKTPTKTVNYVYSNENILTEYTTTGNTTTKKEYINGLGTDNPIAVDQLEPNLTIQERGELNFCNERVTPYASEFAQYGYTNITNRCNSLGGSGAILVTNRYYFHKDNLGSIVGISDNSGTTVTTYDYDSYGNAHIASGIDIGNERLYTGREFDSETGLYFNRARYYNPELGRFISQDPIGQVDDVNLYAYVGNNPVNAVDRNGREKQLLEDIKNGNKFNVELVGRNLNSMVGPLGTHTFIKIHSFSKTGEEKIYTIGGQDINGKLIGIFNEPFDKIISPGQYGTDPAGLKTIVQIPTPNGMNDSQFVQNIYDEYKDYDTNHVKNFSLSGKYDLLNPNISATAEGTEFYSENQGNCSNFATTVLYRASNYNNDVMNEVSNVNVWGFTWGLGDPFNY